MAYLLLVVPALMLVLYLLHATDFFRANDIADFRLPLWFVFTPIVFPIFVVGCVVLFMMYVFGLGVGSTKNRD